MMLEAGLLAELPDEARVVAGRFPFPSWTPTSTLGQGLEQVWAYDMKEVCLGTRPCVPRHDVPREQQHSYS
uniref:Protein FAM173A n=1 Tax=Athene cunicularia TaxID=194338 RepID=A0A663LR22_ATHCN